MGIPFCWICFNPFAHYYHVLDNEFVFFNIGGMLYKTKSIFIFVKCEFDSAVRGDISVAINVVNKKRTADISATFCCEGSLLFCISTSVGFLVYISLFDL